MCFLYQLQDKNERVETVKNSSNKKKNKEASNVDTFSNLPIPCVQIPISEIDELGDNNAITSNKKVLYGLIFFL